MKRVFDLVISAIGLLMLSPILVVFMILVWLQDRHSPLYIAERVGKDSKSFKMVKLRSMIINAAKNGVDSTAEDDDRITRLGHIIRKYKLDELMQLWNVFVGDMSFVGPRPNVKRDVDLYTPEEKGLLQVRPGITDFSSIVFSDEGAILSGKIDPDLEYNRLIRPWKSRLGLIYIKNHNIFLDLRIILYTILTIFSKKTALNYVVVELEKLNVNKDIISISKRDAELVPMAPPGSDSIIENR